MKVCAYLMRIDSGLAPNPFHSICTLALCTPNHQKANLGRDDWIIGLTGSRLRTVLGTSDQWRLIYAMRVDERLGLDDYYRRPEFKAKIPNQSGTRVEQCGDNFYKLVNGELVHTGESRDHLDERGDINGDRAFVGKEFWYFGRSAPVLPTQAWARRLRASFEGSARGIRYVLGGSGQSWGPDDYVQFLKWLGAQAAPATPQPTDFDRWLPEDSASSEKSCRVPRRTTVTRKPATARGCL